MRITAVHTAVVEANYDWTYVRVDADEDGLSGLGECFTAPGLTAARARSWGERCPTLGFR